jgi:pyruvate dehydrogenase E1 component
MERRRMLGGHLPARRVHPKRITLPEDRAYQELFRGTSAKVSASTTGAFTRLLRNLLRDPAIGPRIVPIVPDEARTFGIDALFRQHKIYAPGGQRYDPVDAALLLSYQEATDGQILEEGITEAGAMASFIAAGTANATWDEPMIPFFIYYSMFGFHRFADLLWAAGDMRARGFLLGATAGRTTLEGEGLQHCDGHSLLFATAIPNLRAYDPAFAYEMAVIIRDGITRMHGSDPEDLLYYLTLYNEGFPQPSMPVGVEDGILAGLYLYQDTPEQGSHDARILASGTAMLAALDAQRMLYEEHGIVTQVWSATSFKALRDDALTAERWNRLHPSSVPRIPYMQRVLTPDDRPVIAVTDFVKLVPDQVARWMPQPFIPLGTDGFGLSDTRSELRRHFEVDAEHIVVAVLSGLVQQRRIAADTLIAAMRQYDIDPDLLDPRAV